ncbi:unnamed protein product [Cylindrotheca closterium]|uniref:Orc1-like AAA ATPase domain-containing protein n=1 Tax=Cylindrotheca closterium TaxID=2856 RepID=A0AAD2FJY0_9STRA|nr:unnamed protein product [Cylindrotheca closterium]
MSEILTVSGDESGEMEPASLRSAESISDSEEFLFDTVTGRNSGSGNGISEIANDRLAELTINKLKFEEMGLVGRSEEFATLQNCLSRMMSSFQQPKQDDAENDSSDVPPESSLVQSLVKKELCFIKGFSGVGKTRLAQELKKEVANYENLVFVQGKFDVNNASERPYSALGKAFSAILRELRIQKKDSQIGVLLRNSSVGTAVGMLLNLIPELEKFGVTHKKTGWSKSSFDNSLHRWKFAFRSLTRVLTLVASPLVIVLDDLQRADLPSLEMIQHLISDIRNTNPLMIIGCFRSNEVDSYSVLTGKIDDLQRVKERYGFNVTDIALWSCELEDIHEMIMAMMAIDDQSISQDLAELCFKRTMGNPFFLVEFMKMLQREELISFSLGLMKWTFDVNEIEESTMSTANVATLLQNRIRFLSKDVQELLQLAACLGMNFRVETLLVLWKMRNPSQDESTILDEVRSMLSKAERELLVEGNGYNLYQWVHDKVQEAAMTLNTPDHLNAIQFQVGQQLLLGLDENLLEDDLFKITNLVNRGTEKINIEFAALNLRAAKKARSISAFEASARYAEKGINMLPSNVWIMDRSLALDLYTIGAHMQLISGNIDKADEYSKEIFNQKDISVMETLPMRIARAWTLSSVESKHAEATEYVIHLLRELGYNQIWRVGLAPAQALSAFRRTLKLIKEAPKDFYKSLEIVNDEKQGAISDLLHLLHYSSYMSGRLFLAAVSCCKDVELTMKQGITHNSARSFCNLGGFVLHLQEDYKTTLRLGECAFAIQDIIGEANKGITIQEAHTNGLCFAKPLQQSIPLLAEAYNLSMRAGDTEYANWSLLFSVAMVPYITGKKLGPLLEECQKALTHVEEGGRADHVVTLKLMIHLIKNLQGKNGRQSLRSTGAYFIPDEWKTTSIYIGTVHFTQCEILFFSDLEAAADISIQNGDLLKKSLPGTILTMIDNFHQAVSLYVMARRTKKRKYKVAAKRLRKILQRWEKAGNPNVVHFVMLLDAEDAALSKKIEAATEKYKQAIVFAGRNGELHHAGMFNERYADFLLDVCDDPEGAKYQFSNAIQYYQDWGADGKVGELQEKCERL